MILSAISLWKKFNTKNPLGASEWGIEVKDGVRHSHVSYSGNAASDGSVRVYARFGRPASEGKKPCILLLPDAGHAPDKEMMDYFIEKGYAVLMPDYSGKMSTDPDGVMRTIYPPSLAHGNYERARGLYNMRGLEADETTWFEWTYVALYSVKYLKSRADVGNIGVVGIRKGGEIAWQIMLSPDVTCGIPVNAAGWRSFLHIAKFGDNIAHNLSDDRHRYIAAVEAQSYAPYGNALAYSPESGSCIGPHGLADMDLFLEKNLKGREIYLPDTLNIGLKETAEGNIEVTVEGDEDGLLEEIGVFYAEADVKTKSAFREWRCVAKVDGGSVKNGKTVYSIHPFAGAKAVFVYAYAKYINGFRVMSKIVSKHLSHQNPNVVKSRMLFSGKEMDSFCVANHENYSIGGIFLEREAIPKLSQGYGNILGAYSVGGVKTYKISSPRYIPDENALLEFDVYSAQTQYLKVTVEVAEVDKQEEKYSCSVEVKGGGKWKRIILRAADFKGEYSGAPLQNFFDGSALIFDCEGEEREFSITNILWL